MPGRVLSIAFQGRVSGMLDLGNSNLDGVKLANGVGI